MFRIPELPAKFVVPLKETESIESSTVTLECQLSQPDEEVTWLKDGKKITPSENVELVVDGTWHRLILKDVPLDAEAEYTAKVDDEDSKAMLWVEGRLDLLRLKFCLDVM